MLYDLIVDDCMRVDFPFDIGFAASLQVEKWRFMKLRAIIAFFAVLTAAGQSFAFGQESPKQKRPKIGLVLSGGGARGMAHIGVLEWLEDHRIPVDYVAGTSIGGLIGGMYAMGMTPDEIRHLINTIDWDEILRGTPAFDRLTFRRKQDRRSFQNDIELGLRDGLNTSAGLNPGHKIGLLFDRLTLPYSSIASFDDLPIPFRCVATDMVEARPVILKDGSLSEALRATMSLPGIFTPVERDGRVLADGGMMNNIPTDIAKQMGADLVIAVDVGTPLGDRKALASLLGVLQQAIGVMTIENDRRNLRLADIVLSPELEQYSLLDFYAAKTIADLGYEGARKRALVLENFALDPEVWQNHLAERYSRRQSGASVPSSLEIKGTENNGARSIHERLESHIGQPLSPERLESDLTDIAGEGRYESLGYSIKPDDKERTLLIRAKEKPYGPPFVNLSLEVDGSDPSNVDSTIGARFTVFDAGKYGAEWQTDIRLGSRLLLSTEYYRPFGEAGLFAAPRVYYEREAKDLYLNDMRAAEYRTRRLTAGFDFGYTFRLSELRAGYQIGHINSVVRSGAPLLPALEGKVSEASLRWTFDGQDSPIVPSRGLRLSAEGRWFFDSPGASGDFSQAEINLSKFHPITAQGTIFLIGAGGTTFDKDAPPAQEFTLGGLFRLGAFGRDEFRGNHYLLSGFGYLHQLYKLPPLFGEKIYAGGWYEVGGAFDRIDSARYFNSLSAGIVVVTRLGPIALGGSIGESGRHKFYFSLGKFF